MCLRPADAVKERTDDHGHSAIMNPDRPQVAGIAGQIESGAKIFQAGGQIWPLLLLEIYGG